MKQPKGFDPDIHQQVLHINTAGGGGGGGGGGIPGSILAQPRLSAELCLLILKEKLD